MNHDRDTDPRTVTWNGPRNLEITIPNDARSGRQDRTYRDIIISYRYVPDDPIQRACINEWRDRDSRRPARDTTPHDRAAFLEHCASVLGDAEIVRAYLAENDTFYNRLRRRVNEGYDRYMRNLEDVMAYHAKPRGSNQVDR
jgi:hypothetical protein